MRISVKEVEKTMTLKPPGSLYSSALLIGLRNGDMYVEDGKVLYRITEDNRDYDYYKELTWTMNPHRQISDL